MYLLVHHIFRWEGQLVDAIGFGWQHYYCRAPGGTENKLFPAQRRGIYGRAVNWVPEQKLIRDLMIGVQINIEETTGLCPHPLRCVCSRLE